MSGFEEVQVGSRRFKESSRSDGSGVPVGRRSSGAGRVVAALVGVLPMLMGALAAGTSPVSAAGGPSYAVLATVTVGASPTGVAVSFKPDVGPMLFRNGVMAMVVRGGVVRVGDEIGVSLPTEPHQPMQKV